jgi:PRTRC genetic system protein B
MTTPPFLECPSGDRLGQMLTGMTPRSALVIHSIARRDGTDNAVTLHAISCEGAPTLLPGKLLSHADTETLARTLRGGEGRARSRALLPDGLLMDNGEAMVWWRPSVRRSMHLILAGGEHQSLKVVWPALVMAVSGRELFVASLTDDARPDCDTPLMHAPLGNVYASTKVCLGSSRLPVGEGMGTIPGWDAVIYDTNFTHTNHDLTLAGGATSAQLQAFWRKRTRTRPPRSKLAPLGMTLGEWIDAICEDLV